MLRFFRKYNKHILVVGGCLLMISFLIQPVVDQFMGNPGNPTIGTLDGEEITALDRQNAGSEIALLSAISPLLHPTWAPSPSRIDLIRAMDAERLLPFLQSAGDMGMASMRKDVEARIDAGAPREIDALQWLLMLHDAEKMGLSATRQEAEAIIKAAGISDARLNRALQQSGASVEQVYDALRHWIIVQNYMSLATGTTHVSLIERVQRVNDQVEMAAAQGQPLPAEFVPFMFHLIDGGPVVSEPLLKHYIYDTQAGVRITGLEVPHDREIAEIGAPTEAQLRELYEQYKDELPGEGEPYGFGYRYPDRIKLEYMRFDHTDVVRVIENDPKIVQELETQAYSTYLADRDTRYLAVQDVEPLPGDGKDDTAKDDKANDDKAKDDKAKDDKSKDGASKDGALKDGASKDGASKDGALKDGASKDGASNDAGKADDTSKDGKDAAAPSPDKSDAADKSDDKDKAGTDAPAPPVDPAGDGCQADPDAAAQPADQTDADKTEKADAGKSDADKADTDKADTDKADAATSDAKADDKSADDKSADDKSADDKSADDKSAADKTSDDKTTDKSADESDGKTADKAAEKTDDKTTDKSNDKSTGKDKTDGKTDDKSADKTTDAPDAVPTEPKPKYRPYDEVRDIILRDLKLERARAEVRKMVRTARSLMLEDVQAQGFRKVNGYYPNDVLDAWNPTPLSRVAQEVQSRYGYLPRVVRLDDRWLDREDAAALPDLGDAIVRTDTGPVPFPEYAFSVRRLHEKDEENPLLTERLQIKLPSSHVTNRDTADYVARIIDAERSQAPGFEERREDVDRDARKLAAYKLLKSKLDTWRQRAKNERLETIATELGASVVTPRMFQQRETSQDPKQLGLYVPSVGPFGQSQKLVDTVFELAREVADDGSVTDVPLAERSGAVALDKKLSLVLYRIDEFQPISRRRYESAVADGGGAFILAGLSSADYRSPVSTDALVERLGFEWAENEEEDEEAEDGDETESE